MHVYKYHTDDIDGLMGFSMVGLGIFSRIDTGQRTSVKIRMQIAELGSIEYVQESIQ